MPGPNPCSGCGGLRFKMSDCFKTKNAIVVRNLIMRVDIVGQTRLCFHQKENMMHKKSVGIKINYNWIRVVILNHKCEYMGERSGKWGYLKQRKLPFIDEMCTEVTFWEETRETKILIVENAINLFGID